MQDSLIFDVGCHSGQDSDFYLKKGFRVVAVEANPTLCAALRQRFAAEIEQGRFTLVEKAISEQDGEVEFFINEKATIWGTIRSSWVERNAALGLEFKAIRVPSVRFGSLLKQFGVPYYLKIDIEGADLLCLQELLPWSDRPAYLSIEIEHRSLLREEMRLLTELGYSRFQIVEQGLVPKQTPPRPPAEGRDIEYQFELGASGLFGRELPGPWLTGRGLLFEYYQLLAKNRLFGLSKRIPIARRLTSGYTPTWYDLHAARSVRP